MSFYLFAQLGSVPSKAAVISRSDGDDEGDDSEEDDKKSDPGDLSDSGVEGSVEGYSAAEEFIPLGLVYILILSFVSFCYLCDISF